MPHCFGDVARFGGVKRARLYRRSELEEMVRLRPSDEGPLDRVPMAADWMPYV